MAKKVFTYQQASRQTGIPVSVIKLAVKRHQLHTSGIIKRVISEHDLYRWLIEHQDSIINDVVATEVR